jgi:Uma2 family endonuclease
MSSSSTVSPPALANGDRLSRTEFERRYAAMPEETKAELIEGVVYMTSAVRATHAEPHSLLVTWLGVYAAATPSVQAADNATVRLDHDNEPQPDALLRMEEAAGGQSRIDDDEYLEGPPELVVEIAHSSAAYDLHDKKEAYRRSGVQEYIVWQIEENKVVWFLLEEGRYVEQAPDGDGLLRSQVFPGLVLNAPACRNRDASTVLATLQPHLDTDAHRSFVQHLNEEAESST